MKLYLNHKNMKTLTINTAGKRSTAYTLVNFERSTRQNISLKEAKSLVSGISIFDEGVNYKTYKLS